MTFVKEQHGYKNDNKFSKNKKINVENIIFVDLRFFDVTYNHDLFFETTRVLSFPSKLFSSNFQLEFTFVCNVPIM